MMIPTRPAWGKPSTPLNEENPHETVLQRAKEPTDAHGVCPLVGREKERKRARKIKNSIQCATKDGRDKH
eukprot:15446047-Alexandrium_andersonii.AAC.1